MKKYNTPIAEINSFVSSDCITTSSQGFSSAASGSGDIWDWDNIGAGI